MKKFWKKVGSKPDPSVRWLSFSQCLKRERERMKLKSESGEIEKRELKRRKDWKDIF